MSSSLDRNVHQGNFMIETKESEPAKPDSPKSFIRKITDDNTRTSETPGTSSSESLKRTAEEAGLNNMEVESPKKNRGIVDVEETLFSLLIGEALYELMTVKKLTNDDLSNGIEIIIEAFRYSEGNRFSDIDFKEPKNICAFLHRYGPYAAGLTRFRTLQALDNCPEVLHRFATFSSINIISLGSGPGCDIIGLCSALYEHSKYQRVKLTLVDSVKGWMSVFNILEFLVREGEYGNSSRLFKESDVSTTFLRANLADETEEDVYFSALQEADVIMINKLFSILRYDQKEIIKETVVQTMKVGAVLLFIDSPNYTFEDLELIYPKSTHENQCEYNFQGQATTRFDNSIARISKAQIRIYTKRS